MEAAIRWSPHSSTTQQRFLILNLVEKYLKFYELESVSDEGSVSYKQISQHTKLPNVRAFDWSPTEESLVAVGLPSGEAALLRIDDGSNDTLSFTIRHQRPCNAIALSTNGLLAAGLDKVRNDFCLNIWDVNQRLSTWDRSERGWNAARPQNEPARKLASSETISSIKFFHHQPQTLVTGVKGQFVRIYDLRDSPGSPALQFPTRCTLNLSIDAQDENYFASSSTGGESLVSVWDRRMGPSFSATSFGSSSSKGAQERSGAILEYNMTSEYPSVSTQTSIWSVRYNKAKQGNLAVLTSEGHLRAFETAKEYLKDRQDKSAKHEPLWTKRIHNLQAPYWDEHRPQTDVSRVISFDYMTYGRPERDSTILTYRADGSLQAFPLLRSPPPIDTDFIGDATVATGSSIFRKSLPATDSNTGTLAEVIQNGHRNDASHESIDLEKSSYQNQRKFFSSIAPDSSALSPLSGEFVLGRRATEDYRFSYDTNIKVVAENKWLQGMWSCLKHAETLSANDGMVQGRLDLSLLGIYSIWRRDLGRNAFLRLRDREDELPSVNEFKRAIAAINNRSGRPKYNGTPTSFPEQRQLCLALCGWAKRPEEFETELQSIAHEQSKTKAAAWAMFNGMSRQATQLVMRGDEHDRLVAMALAGFYKQGGPLREAKDSAWMELCEGIREKARDPWSKAILALVTTEDWHQVIGETSLPLRDRIGVALRYLNDFELDAFLDVTTEECIANGDIEGVCLTGISSKTVDLFEEYLLRFNDLSTAVLVVSIGCPVYIRDVRFWRWRRRYQTLLNAAKLQVQRCEYEIQHIEKSNTADGRKLIRPAARQVSLRCNYCDQNIARDDDIDTIGSDLSNVATIGDTPQQNNHAGNPLYGRGKNQGVACPRCGRHLPRCGVCNKWLGVPDPRRPAAMTSQQQQDLLARFMLFCTICNHAFHADHARTWFQGHSVCPVSDCACLCQA